MALTWSAPFQTPIDKSLSMESLDINPDDTPTFVFVCSYNNFDSLAHQPKGTPADKWTISAFKLDIDEGSMTLHGVLEGVENPAFVRMHPTMNKGYVATESIR